MVDYVPDAQMVQFWEEMVAPIVLSLDEGKHHLAVIQQNHVANMELISRRYGHGIQCHLLDKPRTCNLKDADHPEKGIIEDGYLAPFFCFVKEGVPHIGFCIPEIKSAFVDIAKKHPFNFLSVFRSFILTCVMHEHDHLALGAIVESEDIEQLIECERLAWARTCENTLCPFLELYFWEIYKDIFPYYSAWVAGGRHSGSPHWAKFVRDMYTKQSG
jgi:hypothetical protein